jgi:hypothetical protein
VATERFGWMDGWMDGWTDGRTDGDLFVSCIYHLAIHIERVYNIELLLPLPKMFFLGLFYFILFYFLKKLPQKIGKFLEFLKKKSRVNFINVIYILEISFGSNALYHKIGKGKTKTKKSTALT